MRVSTNAEAKGDGMTLDELRRLVALAEQASIPGNAYVRTRNKLGGSKGAKVVEISVSDDEVRPA